jgi:hypothetical protein
MTASIAPPFPRPGRIAGTPSAFGTRVRGGAGRANCAPRVVVETQLLVELLMRLFERLASLDAGCKLFEAGAGKMAAKVELALAMSTMLAQEPALLVW